MADSSTIDLSIERPVAGGRMLARHDGKVVFVAGAIPGERVRAKVGRVQRQAAWADVVEILEPSPDRRDPGADPACGGLSYAHIQYARQLQLKSDVIADAFRRLGRVALDEGPQVMASPETGYRLRARFHIWEGRAGFFREGTHTWCDASPTGQVLPETTSAVAALAEVLDTRVAECEAVIVAENVNATERVMHLEPRDGARLDDLAPRLHLPDGVGGVTTGPRGRSVTLAGSPSVTDTAAGLFAGRSPVGDEPVWTRQAASFFQGNRFLTGHLVRRVLELSPGERVVDLYAGVGLFSVAIAARGSQVVAVEGDQSSGADLSANAATWPDRLLVVRAAVEDVVRRARPDPAPDVVIIDPPRTGVSAEAMVGVARWQAARVIYVSCDPPTLARDAARLIAAGYRVDSIDAFDFFPNTPHVETVVAFDRGR